METKPFILIDVAAAKLGVPAAWLRAEAEAGRVPAIRVGRRLLTHLAAAEQALLDRAKGNAQGVSDAQ